MRKRKMTRKHNMPSSEKKSVWKKIQKSKLFYFGLLLVCSVLFIVPIFFKDELVHFRSLGLLGLFIINFVGSATIFIPAPVIISVGIAGAIYNPFLVALIAALGSSLGEGTGFLFGYSSQELLHFKHHKILYFIMNFLFTKYGVLLILVFSIIPNPFVDGIGIFAGMTGYSWKKFIFWVFIGRLIRNLFIANIAHAL